VEDKEREKQLENNLTRALIVTINNIDNESQKRFVQSLIKPDKLCSKTFTFDLQNTSHCIEENSVKYILVLQRDRVIFDFNELMNTRPTNQGSIPDAWIIGKHETILIETKIGNGVATNSQIYRHITGKNGYNIPIQQLLNGNHHVEIITKTWEDICLIIKSLKSNKEQDAFLLSQLNNYMIMTAQILNLQYIIDRKINIITHKEQFKLFLNKLDIAITKERLPFIREGRNKSGLWEGYGIMKNNKVTRNPHYTVGFSDDAIIIYLTTTKLSQLGNDFVTLLTNFINTHKSTNESFRYNVCQNQYKLVDYKKGQIRGEFQSPFKLNIKFSEINSKNIGEVIKALVSFNKMKIYKQFELGYSIQFYDFSKTENSQFYEFSDINKSQKPLVRELNKEFLENPNKIIDSFINFMKSTVHLFDELNR
jgi:hypothetical protein